MRKRILIVEEADAIRGVTETVLRQNGYEVISISEAAKAGEVLQFSKPDLLIIGADLRSSDQQFYYEKIQEDPRHASLPLLLIASPGGSVPTFPEEAVISQPLDPLQFLQKVSLFLGGQSGSEQVSASASSGQTEVDDEFLDAALGLDQINVTDSEVMDKTTLTKRGGHSREDGKTVGFDHYVEEDSELRDSGRVESLIINEESTDIINKGTQPVKTTPVSGTGKLEIVQDQYGMTDKDALKKSMAGGDSGAAHDYEWFINSMRDDVVSSSPESKTDESVETKQLPPEDSGGLAFTQPASMVDPVTPGPASPPTAPEQDTPKSGGVEKFIGEFKKEMESLRSKEPESVVLSEDAESSPEAAKGLKWEEEFEKLSVKDVSVFSRQLCSELAEKIAEKIVGKIDPDKLLQLIKKEIVRRSESES